MRWILMAVFVVAGGPASAAAAGPLNAGRAFGYLEQVCAIGPRISGSDGMRQQVALLSNHFDRLGAAVHLQRFDARHPREGTPVRMQNLIVVWNPQARDRVLLACHYDTRPYPDRDRLRPRGTFVGANDGASGVALLMELGHHMPALDTRIGVDFVFFDSEEFVFSRNDDYFLGSTYFAEQYRRNPPSHRYHAGILVDMVGDRRLTLYQEKHSLRHAPQLTADVWRIAREQGVREFIARPKHKVLDDHLPLNQLAGIPTIDIIDFDYPYWHTTKDIPRNCSGDSLAKVGNVLWAWLKSGPRLPSR